MGASVSRLCLHLLPPPTRAEDSSPFREHSVGRGTQAGWGSRSIHL